MPLFTEVEVISSTTFSRSNFLSTILNKQVKTQNLKFFNYNLKTTKLSKNSFSNHQSDNKYLPIIISNTSYNTTEFFSYGGMIICINLKNKFILSMICNNLLLKRDLTRKMTPNYSLQLLLCFRLFTKLLKTCTKK